MPFLAAGATTLRQDRWQSLMAFVEERIEQQVRQLGILVEGLLDLAEERAADDAAAAPHEGDAAVVEVPFVFRRRRAHEHVALRVADDLRGVQRLANVVDEFLAGRP